MNKIAVLYDAGQAVLSTFDLDEVLQRILEIAHDYFHLRNVAIVLLDSSRRSCTSARRLAGTKARTSIGCPWGRELRERRRSRSSRCTLPM